MTKLQISGFFLALLLLGNEAIAKERADRWVVTTQAEIADFFGVSPATVQYWVKRRMPGRAGRYNVRAIARWRQADKKPEAVDDDESDLPPKLQKLMAEIDKLRAEVKAKTIKNETAEGNLIDRDSAEQFFSEAFTAVRIRLESCPDEFEMRFPAETREENKADFADYIESVLKELSECDLQSQLEADIEEGLEASEADAEESTPDE